MTRFQRPLTNRDRGLSPIVLPYRGGGFGDTPPAAGTPCVDALFALRTGERRVAPPIAAVLNGGGSQPVIEEDLLFEFGGTDLSVRSAPKAQLVCDFSADVGDLVVKSFDALDDALHMANRTRPAIS